MALSGGFARRGKRRFTGRLSGRTVFFQRLRERIGRGTAMNAIIDFLNTIFWGYVLIYGLLAVGVYFTIRLRFQQILHFGEMFRVVTNAPQTDKEGIYARSRRSAPASRAGSAPATSPASRWR